LQRRTSPPDIFNFFHFIKKSVLVAVGFKLNFENYNDAEAKKKQYDNINEGLKKNNINKKTKKHHIESDANEIFFSIVDTKKTVVCVYNFEKIQQIEKKIIFKLIVENDATFLFSDTELTGFILFI
jgi:hypothetical protein